MYLLTVVVVTGVYFMIWIVQTSHNGIRQQLLQDFPTGSSVVILVIVLILIVVGVLFGRISVLLCSCEKINKLLAQIIAQLHSEIMGSEIIKAHFICFWVDSGIFCSRDGLGYGSLDKVVLLDIIWFVYFVTIFFKPLSSVNADDVFFVLVVLFGAHELLDNLRAFVLVVVFCDSLANTRIYRRSLVHSICIKTSGRVLRNGDFLQIAISVRKCIILIYCGSTHLEFWVSLTRSCKVLPLCLSLFWRIA